MKLPIPLPFGKSEKQKYILALLLRDEKISAIITEEVEGKMRIVGQNEEILTTPLEKLTPEEWLDTLDRTISKAEETLPPDRETHDTVFGVKESWVEEKKIKKEYLLKLKKLSEALDLTPIGFLVISEAITHLIQAEEGAPVSAILVDLGATSMTATLVRGGRVLESLTVPMTDSLTETVDSALKHFSSVEVFPSRLILFSGNVPAGESEKIDHLAQKFISHHWSKSLPFLHAPQISVLHAGFDAKAVVQGAASQMGFEVLNLTETHEEDIKTFDHDEKLADKKGSKKEEKEDAAERKEELETKEGKDEGRIEDAKKALDEETATDDFGFVMDDDVSKHAPNKAAEDERLEPHKVPHPETEERHHVPTHHYKETLDDETTDEDADEEEKRDNPLSNILTIIPHFSLSRFISFLPSGRLPLSSLTSGSRKRKLLIIPIAFIIILGILYYLYSSSVKAEVTLFLKPNNVSETTDVIFSTESGNNFAERIVAAKTVSTTLDGSVSSATTGKKEIGEKAKGNVTIYNNDSSKKQLSGGTTLSTDKGLKFTLDKDVTIASASGDIFSGTKPGTAQVAVTAAEIGTDYNLPSGTKFNVSAASNIAAKNDSAFSGGTQKSVTVVAKKDQDKLLVDLSKSLEGKAKDELNKKVTGDEKLLPFLTQASVTKKKFDKKVDDEAKNVKLDGTVSYEALTFTNKDIEDFALVALKKKYTDDLNLSEKGITYNLSDEKQKGEGEVNAKLTIEGGLIPKLDKTALVRRISGMSIADADAELKRIPQVARAEIKFSPAIPLIPVFLPKGEDRITLNTALDE